MVGLTIDCFVWCWFGCLDLCGYLVRVLGGCLPD